MYMAKEAHAGFEVYAADRDQNTPSAWRSSAS